MEQLEKLLIITSHKSTKEVISRRIGRGSGTRCFSSSSALLVTCLLLLSLFLTSCAPPRPAPVVSREVGVERRYAPTKPGRYRVRPGDTIYSIAWRYGVDHRSFARWNGIRYPYRIYPGRVLKVTPPKPRVAAVKKKIPKPVLKKASKPPTRKISKTKNTKQTKQTKKSTARKQTYASNRKLRWQWPTKGKVSSGFRKGDPNRKGVIMSGRMGQGVMAAEAGTVVYSGSGLIGYGKLLIIKHNKNYLSAYGHNKKLLVKEGDKVSKGSRIAEMGTNGSGKMVLHFEIRRNGVPVNPLRLLPRKS